MSTEPTLKLHSQEMASGDTGDTPSSKPVPEAQSVETPAVSKRLIRLADLFALLDVSKPTGHRLIAAGKIGPRAIRLTSACVRYDAEEVYAWLSTRRPDGNLYDAKNWPPKWEAIRRKQK